MPFRPWRVLASRPRLLASGVVGVSVWACLPLFLQAHLATRMLLAWNAGAMLYLGLVWRMAHTADLHSIRQRAQRQDEGRVAVLVLSVVAALAVLLGVGSQLAMARSFSGIARTAHVGLAALTVVTAWLFTQSLFAVHYAHEFHLARLRHRADPLSFPGTPDPSYHDFLYFACVIGTSGQTADVAFQGSALRGVGTLHCVLAFFFNATVLALAINMAAGLF